MGVSALGAEKVSSERSVIFSSEAAQGFVEAVCLRPPEGITGYWTPTASDLIGVETILGAYLQKVKPPRAKWLLGDARTPAKWSWIIRQTAGVLKGNGKYLLIVYHFEDPAETARKEKEVEARAVQLGVKHQPYYRWTAPLVFHGRGSAFYRVLFDLQKREFVWYEENPEE